MTDDAKIWAAFISGSLALIGTIYIGIVNYLGRREQDQFKAATDKERDERLAQREAEKIVSKFRDPLLHAAYDLQSRIFNILQKAFLKTYYANGSDRDKEYAIENTVFLVAQFLGWTELIRQEIQFLDLGSDDDTRKLRSLQDNMYTGARTTPESR